MAAEPKIFRIPPDSELADIVDQSEETPVVLERNERRFRLVREAPEPSIDSSAAYDPDRVLQAFERASGIFSGMDVEELKAELREQRVQDVPSRLA